MHGCGGEESSRFDYWKTVKASEELHVIANLTIVPVLNKKLDRLTSQSGSHRKTQESPLNSRANNRSLAAKNVVPIVSYSSSSYSGSSRLPCFVTFLKHLAKSLEVPKNNFL